MWAQTPDPSAPAIATLDEIVVTARKRTERAQDTPISITAIRGDALKARNVENVRDLQMAVPNLSAVATQAGSSANAQIYIRGIGQYDYRVTADQGVGLYLDGVYMARSLAASLDIVDIERVEILRGPQGTLFGRNTLGGALQIVTVKPQPEFGGYVEATAGSRNRFDLRGAINIPIVTDKLAARITGSRLRQEGYGLRLFQDVRTGDTTNDGGRVQLLWTPSPDISLLASGDYARRRGNSSTETLLAVLEPSQLDGYNADLIAQGLLPITQENFVTGNPYTSFAGSPNGDDYDAWGGAVTGDWQIGGGFALKSITAYRRLDSDSNFDFGSVPYPFSWQDITIRQRQFSQELQLNYNGLDDRLEAVVGLYYFYERGRERDLDPYFEQPIATGAGPLSFTVRPDFINGYRIFLDQTTRSYAAFAQATYKLTDKLGATVGLRYTQDEKRLTESFNYNNTYQFFTFDRPLGTIKRDWNDFSPHFGLEYKPDPDLLVYATASKGFRAGGFNGFSFQEVRPESFDPETIWNLEGGIKSELFDRRLRFNVGGFYYIYDGVVGTSLQDAAFIQTNLADLNVYGGEFEIVFAATDQLQLTAAGGYLGQRIRAVIPGGENAIRPDTRLPNLPEFTLDGGIRYAGPIGRAGELAANAEVSFRTRSEFLLPNYPGEAQVDYALVNASISFTPTLGGNDPLTLTLFGRNLTDYAYRVYGENDVAFGNAVLHAQFGRPREWGVSARMRF